METYIVKRDGKYEVFAVEKIKAAIAKSFLASGAFATEETMTGILSHLNITSGISVEEIQNQVEVALMASVFYLATNFLICDLYAIIVIPSPANKLSVDMVRDEDAWRD